MFLLRHSNVDGSSTWGKFEEKPNEKELTELFEDYYDKELSERLAEEILDLGEADAENGSCDRFELEEV
jgi:hypothetical protein